MQTHDDALPGTLILGLGKTGRSCARYLRATGVAFAVSDSRQQPPDLAGFRHEFTEVPCFLGGFDAGALAAAQELIVSPGISLATPALREAAQAGKSIVGDIELFARAADAPVIAITGTNGKSTVTDLLGVLAAHCGVHVKVGGNIGTPALDLLPWADAAGAIATELYVLEVSSFQLETTYSLNAVAATILNITEDHMDRYQDIQDYLAAKRRVFQGQGVVVLNRDDPMVAALAEPGRATVGFTLQPPEAGDFGVREIGGVTWLCHGNSALLPVSELKLKGKHNHANALAALALGNAFGLPMPRMLAALRGYGGLPHRTNWVGSCRGVDWYNDSKGTNVGATLAAVSGMDRPVVLIAGGDGKGADFSALSQLAPRLRALVLIGRDGPRIGAVLSAHVNTVSAENMTQAVRAAASLAQTGDCVLLSPACASFDMYDNYEHRGRDFVQQVQHYIGGGG